MIMIICSGIEKDKNVLMGIGFKTVNSALDRIKELEKKYKNKNLKFWVEISQGKF